MIKSAEGSVGLLHKITRPAERRTADFGRKKKRMSGCWTDVKQRAKSGQSIGNVTKACSTWRTSRGKIEKLKKLEEALPRLKECDLKKASRLHKASPGLDKRNKKVSGGILGKLPQQSCTTMLFM